MDRFSGRKVREDMKERSRRKVIEILSKDSNNKVALKKKVVSPIGKTQVRVF